MKKLLIVFLGIVLLTGVWGQVAEAAAKWKFHAWPNDGVLIVYATKDCQLLFPPLFGPDTIQNCREYGGPLPPAPANDWLKEFQWVPPATYIWGTIKAAKPYWEDRDGWKLYPLAEWIENNVPDCVVFPSLYDETQSVYAVVDIGEWLADPRPLQDEYTIIDGECDDLPGYLIGTTPITFDRGVGPEENPFQTTPLTGTVVRDGEITFMPEAAIPTLTEWGLIIFGVVLLGFITWVFLTRRKAVKVRI